MLDPMTFEVASATFQPSLVGKILELDDQMQNHRVTPTEALAWLDDRLERAEGSSLRPLVQGGPGADRAHARRQPSTAS